MSLFFYAQWGSAPNIAALFDPRAISAVGRDNIAGAWLSNRAGLLTQAPRIVGLRATRAGTLATVDLLSQASPPEHESFLFVRLNGRWHVRYDTLTQSWIGPYVQSVVQDQLNPTANVADRRAVTAGVRASRAYLLASLSP